MTQDTNSNSDARAVLTVLSAVGAIASVLLLFL